MRVSASKRIPWPRRSSLRAPPKPDPAHLDDETILLPIDVDMTLEVGREVLNRIDSRNLGTLMRGDFLRGPP